MNAKILNWARTGKKLLRNKRVNFLLKILIVIGLGWALYAQVLLRENLPEIWSNFKVGLENSSFYIFLPVVFLMPVNWLLEILKWRLLMERVEKISFFRAMEGVFAGISLSMFTPNRIGEYAGRILAVKPENNIKTIVVTLVGSISQLTILISAGVIGLSIFAFRHLDLDTYILYGISFSSGLLILMMLFAYLNIDIIRRIAGKIKWLKFSLVYLEILEEISSLELWKVLGLSTSRYLTYSIQYLLLLYFFGIEVSLVDGLAGISLIFLLQTSIPLPPLWGLLLRAELAVLVWSYFQANEMSVLSATFGLWIINVILPALAGLVFILRVNVLKSLGIEDEAEVEEA